MALLSNPMSRFIRYTAVIIENKTINMARGGLSLYSQLDQEFESPIKKKEIKLIDAKYLRFKKKVIIYTCKVQIR